MTAFTEEEQWSSDLDWFAIDKHGKIVHFTSVGWRLLPPSIAESKENLEKVFDYFDKLNFSENHFEICPDLQNHLVKDKIVDFDRYKKSFAAMASRGLYSYDSYGQSHKERPYFRVAIPKRELTLNDLPQDIKSIIESLKILEVSFAENPLISEEIVDKL